MKRGILYIWLGLMTVLVSQFGVVSPASAADETVESITLSPVSKRYELSSGDVKQDDFTIVNDGKVSYTFNVYAQPYFVKGESYDPDYFSKSPNSDVNKWVSFEKTQYVLKPGESTLVPFTITVPKTAAPGGHYGIVFSETQAPKNTTGGTSVARQKRVGMIIYATVKGQFITGGEVVKHDTPFFQFKAPLEASITVKNNGNADFLAKTAIEVSDVFGNSKYSYMKEYAVLPETTRRMPLEWKDAPGIGLFKVTTTVDFLDDSKTSAQFVLMAPLWLYLVLAVAIMGGIVYLSQRER